MNNIRNIFLSSLAVVAGLVAMYSCTDTWNEHYNAAPALKFEGTTMQALEENASDFAKLVKAYGYGRELSSDNIYTIWAPADGTFNVSDYFNEDGTMKEDSLEVMKEFVKNHVARYALSLNSETQSFTLMNEKKGVMTSDGFFGDVPILKSNISCGNGILHVIDGTLPYSYNLFELIAKQYQDDTDADKDSLSLYAFLYDTENNKDSLVEDKSVSRGVDENGNKIWVDSFVIRNNTVLKNVDAKLYEEDSSFIAIIPTAKAWAERYKIAEKLLNFNPIEDSADSLTRHYANMFAMTDLYFNKNANEFWEDSLKSTVYNGRPWYEHVYYSKMPRNLPEDKEINDILAKCGTPFECSNGVGYIVDEYPMSIYEQFFYKIKIAANARSINLDIDTSGKNQFTNNVSTSFRTYEGTVNSVVVDSINDTVMRKTIPYNYVDIVPSTTSVNPTVAFDVPNTLSGTYDIYLVTCPIWLGSDYTNAEELDARKYRFYVNLFQREYNEAKKTANYPSSGMRLINPLDGNNYFETQGLAFSEDGFIVVNDTTFLGSVTMKNAYYGRDDEGVVIQLQTNITSRQTTEYSRQMLISSIILKPHDDEAEPVIIAPANTKQRKGTKVTISKINN